MEKSDSKDNGMRITHILDTFGGGGKERRCLQLIQGLNKAGYKDIQVIIINNDIAYKELYNCDCELIIMDRRNRKLGFFATLKELKKYITSFSPDIVQAWGIISAFFTIFITPFYQFKFISSYVADVVKPNFLTIKWFTNNICKHICVGIIGNSKAGLMAYGISSKKSVLIYNGFNEERVHIVVNKENKKEELNINTKYIVLQAASINLLKDWQCYIDAAKIIVSKRKDITFLCAGDGPLYEYYNKQIKDNERDLIKMIGRRSDLDEIYQISDLSVLCTNTTVKEGLSNTIVESMAFGVPVLATKGGGTPEIVKNGDNGFIISKQTPLDVSKQIEYIINNDKLRYEISKKSKETISEKFMLKEKVKEYIAYYNTILYDI